MEMALSQITAFGIQTQGTPSATTMTYENLNKKNKEYTLLLTLVLQIRLSNRLLNVIHRG